MRTAYLKGEIKEFTSEGVIVDLGGVGYEVFFKPKSKSLRVGDIVELFCFERINNDEFELFGFETSTEREIFKILTKISGVGPKTAHAIISQLSLAELLSGIQTANVAVFNKVKGVGLRTAEKIVFELKNFLSKHVDTLLARSDFASNDELDVDKLAVSALEKLGINKILASSLVSSARTALENNGVSISPEILVQESLKVATNIQQSPRS
ncbi:MAG: Holliday junction branch migration protein RuvA [Deltaproteobacteria bacterium]|nr:Holliday junction branch migration protein RuvA [Deltaproteobacteria bacterium]